MIAELRDMGLPTFWEQTDTYINQKLHRLLGHKRLVVVDGEILNYLIPQPPEKRT